MSSSENVKWNRKIHLTCSSAVQLLNPVQCDVHFVCTPSLLMVVLHCDTQTMTRQMAVKTLKILVFAFVWGVVG